MPVDIEAVMNYITTYDAEVESVFEELSAGELAKFKDGLEKVIVGEEVPED